jgi:hypothetical protein
LWACDYIDAGKNIQAWRIHVKSGAKLAGQKQSPGAEYLLVVSGVADVLSGEDVDTFNPSELI